MKNLWLKIFLILLLVILLVPCIYIIHDRMIMPPPPPWVSPRFIPGQKWEQMAYSYLNTHPDNSLKNYLNAFSMASINSSDKAWHSVDTILRIGWTQDYPDVDALIEFYQPALKEIMTGAEMKKCDLPPTPYDWSAPIPPLLRIQYLSKLMAVCGKKLEYQNRPKDAVRYYLDGIQFGKDIGQKDQTLIAKLISIAVIAIETNPILNLISTNKLGEDDYQTIIRELERIEQEQSTFAEMLQTEERSSYTFLYNWSSDINKVKEEFGEYSSGSRKVSPFVIYIIVNRGRILKNKLDYGNELIDASTTKSYQEFVRMDWDQRAPRDWFNRIALPNYAQAYTRIMTITAKVRLAEIQAAIHLYRLKKHQFPNSFQDLEPEYISKVPLDPFTDKSFLWGQDSTGPFAYSTGPDFRDDHVQIIYDPTNGTMSTGDIRP